MGKVHVDITMSLDGYVAGRNDGPDLPLGEGGERIHEWIFGLASWRERHGLEGGERNSDSEVVEESVGNNRAVVLGKRMYENAGGWGDEPPFHLPVFVLTHETREPEAKQGDTTFTFVNEGIDSAVSRAQAAAGDRDVLIAGGANTIQQALRAGLVDEVQIHLVPLLLGGGVRLFEGLGDIELETTRVIESSNVTHLRYRVAPSGPSV